LKTHKGISMTHTESGTHTIWAGPSTTKSSTANVEMAIPVTWEQIVLLAEQLASAVEADEIASPDPKRLALLVLQFQRQLVGGPLLHRPAVDVRKS
jgi:hypothetical protein